MPWITTAPMSSGRLEKQSWIARIMPSLSALRLAGRLSPTVSTAPVFSIFNSSDWPALAAGAAFPMGFIVSSAEWLYFITNLGGVNTGLLPIVVPREGRVP